MSGLSNVEYWLEDRGIEARPELVAAIFRRAKESDRMLLDEEILEVVQRFTPAPARPLARKGRGGPVPKSPGPSTRFLDRELPTYLDHLAVERGLSAASVAAYGSDLEAFGRFLAKSRIDAAKASRRDLGRYLTELRGRGLSARSASRALSAVRGFYGFAAAHLVLRGRTRRRT